MLSRIQLLTASTVLFATAAGAAVWKWQKAEQLIGRLNTQIVTLQLAALSSREHPKSLPSPLSAPTSSAPAPALEASSSSAAAQPSPEEETSDEERSDRRRDFRVNARLSTVEKFIPLTDEQRKALADLFNRDVPWREQPGENERDEFAEIVGKENAQYYRDQMKQAFEQAEAESQEKEVLYMSKRLSLSPEQEAQVTAIMKDVSTQVRESLRVAAKDLNQPEGTAGGGANRGGRIRRILAENSMRQEMLNQQLQNVLTPEQYRLYLEQQANSTDNRFQVWHNE